VSDVSMPAAGGPPRLQRDARAAARRQRRGARATAPARRVSRAWWTKPLVFGLALGPLLALAWRLFTDDLGGDPIEALEQETGTWALRFVAITLALTPLRALTGWNALVRYRRMLGLFAFFYATVHLCVYAGLDMELSAADLVEDVVEHPYVTIGFATWLLLLPLAVTSTTGWVRRLGGRRWRLLHRLTYVVAVTGTIHYLWAVKKDTLRPFTYALVFAALLGWRLWAHRRGRAAGPRAAEAAA
jgi:methionine sulfoxide reductase heme-binding subunit